MSGFLVQTFGPVIQLFFAFGLFLLGGVLLGGFSFLGGCRLLRAYQRRMWGFFVVSFGLCLLYGVLRFCGLIVYAADGWDMTGFWNCTNQNHGAAVVYVCGCLLIGTVLAAYHETKKKNGVRRIQKI